jgi:hypothetical protein
MLKEEEGTEVNFWLKNYGSTGINESSFVTEQNDSK